MIKSDEEVALLRESGQLVSKVLAEVGKLVKPGITTLELDKWAEQFIRDHKAIPGFKGYQGFPATLCTSVNNQVVHGIPSPKVVLREGDIVSVDCGVILNNYHGDSAFTFEVGEVSAPVKALLAATRQSVFEGIAHATESFRMGDLGASIQEYCEKLGYSVVRELVGHGIGTKLHERPEVPNYGRRGVGMKLKRNMVICIEPMINEGKRDIFQLNDGWTISTRDQKPSAHFELMVAVGEVEAEILSTFSYIDQVIT